MSSGRSTRGFSLIETLTVVAILALLLAFAIPALRSALTRARTNALVADGRVLLLALKSYCAAEDDYPSSRGKPTSRLDLVTLSPLTQHDLIADGEAFTRRLQDGRISRYKSFSGGKQGTGFYCELSLARDPRVKILLADTDRYPSAKGVVLDGVFILAGGEILTPPAPP